MAEQLMGNVVVEYMERYPDLPNLTLAKLIYKENPSLYKSIETARSAVRYRRGQNGQFMRDKNPDRTLFREAGDKCAFERVPEGLTHYQQWTPYQLEHHRVLILADLHIPYHDKEALVAAIKHAKKRGNIDAIVLLGDVLDFYALSSWQKDPRKRDFGLELDMSYDTLDAIRQLFPDIPIYYKEGNHEERAWRYMAVKAPELIGMKCLSLEAMIKADHFKLGVITEKRIIKMGHLHLVHGHEFWRGIFSPVNPARGLYLRGKENALCAHWHQSSYHPEKSMADDVTACWSIGCLCDLHPDYSPINKWNHGFCIVDLETNGQFYVDNKTIIRGEVY